MNKIMSRIILSIALASLTLSGCGGSGEQQGSPARVSMGTVAKSVAGASGQVNTVNNVTFDTNNATVTKKLEGLVSGNDASAGTFTLNGQQVRLVSATSYSHGAASEIANGVKMRVEGEVTNGVLTTRTAEIDGDHGLPVLVQTCPSSPSAPVTPVTPATLPIPVPLLGKTLYDVSCSGCHMLGTYDSTGPAPNLAGKGSVIAGKLTGGHKRISLNAQQISDLTAFVNAN